MKERVVVAMSGGVDSSVAAALCVEQGFEVIGITLNLAGGGSRCCSLEDADDARRVAETLGIPFYVADHREDFRREIMEPFADTYLAGRTPIPCVACNQRFKFRYLLARARALGASAVATGHYARLEREADGIALHRARDRSKDQSYFLFDLDQEQLAQIRFPLGAMTKQEVRARAHSLGLATADKPESQEICFVPDGDYARVVEALRPAAREAGGEIVDATGRRLGRHAGVHRFTVGQRRGLGISTGEPVYVTAIDAEAQRVVVGPAEALLARGAVVETVSWVAGTSPPEPLRTQVQIRYRHVGAAASLHSEADGSARICFDEPQRAVTPGQAAVLYDGDRVLGGGWIRGALA